MTGSNLDDPGVAVPLPVGRLKSVVLPGFRR